MDGTLSLEQSLFNGTAAFNSGRYWDAHEAWESAWLTLMGPDKALLQAYIMAAGALVLLEKRRPDPARRLASRYFERMKDGAGAALAPAMQCKSLDEIMHRILELPGGASTLDCETILQFARQLRIQLRQAPNRPPPTGS